MIDQRLAPSLLATIREISTAAKPVYDRGVPITCTAPPKLVQPYFDFTTYIGPDCVIGLLDEIERLREGCAQMEWERDKVMLAADRWIERQRKALSKQGIVSGHELCALAVLETDIAEAIKENRHE